MAQNSITLRQIEYFLTLAKTLNFSRAAENLYTTQSTLSRQIQMLEQDLGVELFYRRGKKVELSSAGSYLQAEFEYLMDEIEIVIGNARKLNAQYTKTVTLGVCDLEEIPGLPKAMQIFRGKHPDIFVKIKVAPFRQLIQDIQTRELDIICCMKSPASSITGLRHCCLRKGRFFCLVPKDSPLTQLKELRAADILGYPWIFRDAKNTTPVMARVQRELREMCPSNPILYSASPAQSALMVRAGFGISVVVGYSILPSEEHCMIPFSMPAFHEEDELDLIALWDRNCPSPAVTDFVQIISSVSTANEINCTKDDA